MEKFSNREVGLPWGLDCPPKVHTCYLRASLSPWGHRLPQGKDHSWLSRLCPELTPGLARRTHAKRPGCVQLEAQESVLSSTK